MTPPCIIGCTWSPPRLSLPPCSHVADTDLNPKMEQWSYASYAIVIATYGNGMQRLHSPGVIPPGVVLPGYRPSDLWSHLEPQQVRPGFLTERGATTLEGCYKDIQRLCDQNTQCSKIDVQMDIYYIWWKNVKCQSTWLKAAQADNIVISFVSSSLYHVLSSLYFLCGCGCFCAHETSGCLLPTLNALPDAARRMVELPLTRFHILGELSTRHARRYDTTSLTSGCRQWGQAGNMFGCKEASEASVYGYDCDCIIHVLRFAWLLLRMRNR